MMNLLNILRSLVISDFLIRVEFGNDGLISVGVDIDLLVVGDVAILGNVGKTFGVFNGKCTAVELDDFGLFGHVVDGLVGWGLDGLVMGLDFGCGWC